MRAVEIALRKFESESQAERSRRELEEARNKISFLEREVSELKANVSHHEKAYGLLEAENRRLQEDIKRKRNELSDARDLLSRSEKSLKNSAAQVTQAEGLTKVAEAKASRLEGQLLDMKARHAKDIAAAKQAAVEDYKGSLEFSKEAASQGSKQVFKFLELAHKELEQAAPELDLAKLRMFQSYFAFLQQQEELAKASSGSDAPDTSTPDAEEVVLDKGVAVNVDASQALVVSEGKDPPTENVNA